MAFRDLDPRNFDVVQRWRLQDVTGVALSAAFGLRAADSNAGRQGVRDSPNLAACLVTVIAGLFHGLYS
jgi:hypothetical protein